MVYRYEIRLPLKVSVALAPVDHTGVIAQTIIVSIVPETEEVKFPLNTGFQATCMCCAASLSAKIY
jgi:hypothetical protein